MPRTEPRRSRRHLALGYAAMRSVSTEEITCCHVSRNVLVVVVAWLVEKLSVLIVITIVILGIGHIEVGQPAQFPVDVPLLHQLGVLWLPGAFYVVYVVGV